jgi:hypothetical protein
LALVETHDSGEYRWVRGKLQRNRVRIPVRGRNDNHNKDLKSLFQSAAISASPRPGPLRDFYGAGVEKGMRPTMARLPLARKIATITLTMWKIRSGFRSPKLTSTSSLSISGEERLSLSGISLRWWSVGFWRCSVREEYQSMRSGPACFGTESPISRYALSDNQK